MMTRPLPWTEEGHSREHIRRKQESPPVEGFRRAYGALTGSPDGAYQADFTCVRRQRVQMFIFFFSPLTMTVRRTVFGIENLRVACWEWLRWWPIITVFAQTSHLAMLFTLSCWNRNVRTGRFTAADAPVKAGAGATRIDRPNTIN